MALRKPKHDNFSKLGFKIDRLNQTRNQKNISNIVGFINRQEKEYKLTDFDIFLYHIYSKPLAQCLTEPNSEEADKESPQSAQEQAIVYQQMKQYLAHLKELRGELQNDHKSSNRHNRSRRLSVQSDDQSLDAIEEVNSNSCDNRGSRFQFSNKVFEGKLRFSKKALNSSSIKETHQSFLNDASIPEKRDNRLQANDAFYSGQERNGRQQRSKTEEGYSEMSGDTPTNRQELPKLLGVDTLKQRKHLLNQQQLNMFYGTKQTILKASVEERSLKEELEELQHRNKYKLKLIEQKNEMQPEGNSAAMSMVSNKKKKMSDNIHNLQFYDKIIPQNASLTQHPKAYNSVIKDAHKRQQSRLRGENTAAQDQEFERNIINIIHSPEHKVNRRGGVRDDLFLKYSKEKLIPLNFSTINTTLSPREDTPRAAATALGNSNEKHQLKERVSFLLDQFNFKSMEMDYQLKKSRAFINQVEDSDLEDTQTFDKKLYLEKNKHILVQLEKKARANKQESLKKQNNSSLIHVSNEENTLQPQGQGQESNQIDSPIRQNLSPKNITGMSPKIRTPSSMKQQQGLHKIFNKSLCSSLAGSQILNEIKTRKYSPTHQNQMQEKINQQYSENENSQTNLHSPTCDNNREGTISVNGGSQLKNINENRRMTQENSAPQTVSTPPRIKLISASPLHSQFAKEQLQFHQDSPLIQNSNNNNKTTNINQYSHESQSLANIKSNVYPSPLILGNKQAPLQNYEEISLLKNGSRKSSPIHFQQQESGEKDNSSDQQNIAISRNQIQSELQTEQQKLLAKKAVSNIYQNPQRESNFDSNFSTKFYHQELQMGLVNSEKKTPTKQNSTRNSNLKFYSQAKRMNSGQMRNNSNLPKLEAIQSQEQFDSSFNPTSAFSHVQSPHQRSKMTLKDEKPNKFISEKKKIYPKINWDKYKNEGSLIDKMDELTTKAKSIKQQFHEISKQFKNEIDSSVIKDENKEQITKEYFSQIMHTDLIKKEGNFVASNNPSTIFDDKEKLRQIIKQIEKDSINLQFYVDVEEKINQNKKKYKEESLVKNIQAYHLSDSPMLKKD